MLSLRLAILDLARRHGLPPASYDALLRFATGYRAPSTAALSLRHATGLFAMLLCGLGVIFLVASNWNARSAVPMFVGLQAVVLIACIAAARLARLRAPLALLGFLATGALLAFFGQYYQSGSDPWQLFALWAGLSLPLAFASRSDGFWSAWAIVAMTAISLWIRHYMRGEPGFHDGVFLAQFLAITVACALCVLLSRPLRRFTGAGDWSLNLGVLYAVLMTCACGLWSLFDTGAHVYLIALVLLAVAAAYFGRRAFDVRALTMCALGLDVLIVAAIINVVSQTSSMTFSLLVVSLTTLVILYFTATGIQSLARARKTEGMQ